MLGPSAERFIESAKAAFIHGYSQSTLVLAVATVVGAIILGLWAPAREPLQRRQAEPAPYGRHAKPDDQPLKEPVAERRSLSG
jgi:hypothetical protein